MTALPARGEVWWCELAEVGRRPVVVLSRDAAIPRLQRTLIGPCTTTIRGIPSEVVLEPGEDPVPLLSAVNLDSVEGVSVGVLVERLGRLSDERMRQICAALEDSNFHGPIGPQGPQPESSGVDGFSGVRGSPNRRVSCTDWTLWTEWMLSRLLSRTAGSSDSRRGGSAVVERGSCPLIWRQKSRELSGDIKFG